MQGLTRQTFLLIISLPFMIYDLTGYYDYRDTYINGGGPRHSKYYRCDRTEQRLSDCDNYNDTNFRYEHNDVGMYCALGK